MPPSRTATDNNDNTEETKQLKQMVEALQTLVKEQKAKINQHEIN